MEPVKCPKCGAIGNKLKNVRFMNFCGICSSEGVFYDDKLRVYRYEQNGKLRRIGRPGVFDEPTKGELEGLNITEVADKYGVPKVTAKEWLKKHGLLKPDEKEVQEDMAFGDKAKHAMEVLPKDKFEQFLSAGKTDMEIASETNLELWLVKKIKKKYGLVITGRKGKQKKVEQQTTEPLTDPLQKLDELKQLAQVRDAAEPGPTQPTNQDDSQDGTEEEADLLRQQKEAAEKEQAGWIVRDPEKDHQFKTEEEAVNHILNNYSLNNVKNVMLLKVVPFVLQAKVITAGTVVNE